MSDKDDVIDVRDENFDAEVLSSELPVLVDFGATWCGPCRALEPILAKFARENVGRVKVARIDIDEAPGVVKRYGIRSAPTLVVFRAGEKRAQHVGLTTKERILELTTR